MSKTQIAECWESLETENLFDETTLGKGEPMRVDCFFPLSDDIEYRLYTWEAGYCFTQQKERIAYTFVAIDENGRRKEIFSGSDFYCSPMWAIDSDQTVLSLLGCLTLREGDTDDEYFENYTPAQREFSESYSCEILGVMVHQWSEEDLEQLAMRW